MWAGGVAAGAALVARWAIVGPGYIWLAGGVTLLLGIPAALAGGGLLVWTGCALAAGVITTGRRGGVASLLGASAALFFGIFAGIEGHPAIAVTGALFLGGVTVEMLLGHWYLVDPTLPWWALRRLAVIAAAGAAADAIALALLGVFPWTPGDAALGIGFAVLAVASLVLLMAVIASLREESYSGVMAATGLSYLALLTAIGAVVVGRLVLDGAVLL